MGDRRFSDAPQLFRHPRTILDYLFDRRRGPVESSMRTTRASLYQVSGPIPSFILPRNDVSGSGGLIKVSTLT